MIRSKIDPATVATLTWKAYTKLFEKDIKQAEDKALSQVPLVMISDFTFACGEVHTLILLGKQSALTKFYKSLKTQEERKKLKDFSIGTAHFEQDDNQQTSITFAIDGFGKPNKMKKNSKKLAKKLGLTIKDIIKGELVEEVVEDILQEEQQLDTSSEQEKAQQLKEDDDQANDTIKLTQIAKAFVAANKAMTTQVITQLKAAPDATWTKEHVQIAQQAFRAAASLLDKYEEVLATGKDLARSSKKITALQQQITQLDLVRKYEAAWRKIVRLYEQQMDMMEDDLDEGRAQAEKEAFLDDLAQVKATQMKNIENQRKKIASLLKQVQKLTTTHA